MLKIETSKIMPVIRNHFEAIKWIIKATSTDPIRQTLHYLYSENGFLFATDGSRIHMYMQDIDDLPTHIIVPDGLYGIVTNTQKMIILDKVELDIQFPDIWRVLDYNPTNRNELGYLYGDEWPFFAKIARKYPQDFQFRYIMDAYIKDARITCESAPYHNVSPLVIGINDDRLALIMPFQS